MELLISQHWRLPTAIVIPTLQNRLGYCFHKGISMAVAIHSVDWVMILGQRLPVGLVDLVRSIEKVDGTIPVANIRLGDRTVFQVLHQEWYIQKDMLFISEKISTENLDFAIQSWLHELALYCSKDTDD